MYSIVLMAALTAGEAAPDHGYKGGYGCAGCRGGFAGCWGVAGCFQCHGCHGCYGCYGCHGFGAGYGACYGVCYGGFQPYGGAMGPGWGMPYGCYAPAGYTTMVGHGCYAAPMITAPAMTPAAPSGAAPKGKGGKEEEGAAGLGDRARLIVDLPADARLFVDDQPIRGDARSFRTPKLAAGQTYYYELRAEAVRDGKPVRETRRVVLKAGDVIRADFGALSRPTGVAAAK